MPHDSLGDAAEKGSGETATPVRAEYDEVDVLILGNLDQGATGRRMLNDHELDLCDPLEELRSLSTQRVSNGLFDLDSNIALEQVRS